MERAKAVFGVKVSIGANSKINTYVCYLYNGRVLTKKRIVDEQSFIKIVSGEWPTIYNPKRINYFAENNIGCGMIEDTNTLKKIGECVPFDSLWKIRFSTYPFQNGSERGWSNKYHKPSPLQEKYLHTRYGVGHVDGDFFLDTNFWLLLQDVRDPTWIQNYKSLR
ncbi:MAG: hypothetical protein JKY09_05000 [Crocinitomicaceae bacterium]|nr:hypothetical protein [Crocinitomicaceae bacterium]